MRRLAALAALCAPLALALAIAVAIGPACQKATTESAVPADYRADLENLCDAEARSGALEQDPNTRAMVVAQWLGTTIKTQRARSFMASLASLAPSEKASALRKAAAEAGLDRCALADAWK